MRLRRPLLRRFQALSASLGAVPQQNVSVVPSRQNDRLLPQISEHQQ